MSMLRKIQRVGKRATKFQYTATYQSVVVECLRDRWRPNKICVSWTRKGRRLITKMRPWQQSPDNNARGVVIWPEPEIMEITITLYKGPKDKSYETKEWEFAIIDVDANGKRKVLATTSINMVRYASSMPYDHDLHLRLKPTSRKIKTVMLEVSLTSKFLKEGKATDDDMISLASMMSVSNLSTIGFLEDEDDDYYWTGGRSVTPPMVPQDILSTDQLLKWSQEVTKNLPSVKITNMTTSWRSGLGFLAIILYYRPDLVPDFDMLSPNTLKENNILAFEIARSLGIACTLTPNMMVTATVPDKLAVTSFVYQMYQYFTRATQSAITRQNAHNVGSGANSPTGDPDKKSPSSPFDIKNFDLFATRNSPVTTPPADTNKVNMYSRHSRDESQNEVQLQQPSGRSPRSISPILAQQTGSPYYGSAHEEVKPTEYPAEGESQPDSSSAIDHSSSVSTKDEGAEKEEEGEISPRTSAKLKLDELVSEHAHLIQPTSSKEATSNIVDQDVVIAEVPSSEGDRVLEFENLVTTDESTSEPQSSSTVSLLDDDDDDTKRIPELPLDNVPLRARRESDPTQKSEGRKLPAIPTELPVSVEDEKREERRRRAKEMLRKHNIGSLKLPSSVGTSTSPSSTKDNKYRQQAIDMLGKVFGTPETVRRVRKPGNEYEDITSGDSTTSFEEGRPKKITRPRSATVSSSLQRSARSESYLRNMQANRTNARTEPQHELAPPDTRSRSRSFGNSEQHEQDVGSVTTSQTHRHESRPTSIELNADSNELEKRLSDGQLEATVERTSPSSPTDLPRNRQASPDIQGEKAHKPVSKRSSKTEGSRPSANQRTSPARTGATTTNATNRQRKKAAKPLPTPRPLSDKPSTALKKLTEQKKGESEPTKTSVQTDGVESYSNEAEKNVKDMDTSDKDVEANHLQNGGIERGPTNGDAIVATTTNASPKMQSVAKMEGSPAKKKTLPSPAWSEHDDELSKDILVTQSEYVKHELIRLRQSLQDLEDRASTIETDIRHAMSEGDREQEEGLMKEWFGILNKKNELIKRQMELNFVEKEEDLEKRQFFLNRELRPLMEIPENDKTAAQKDREAHLLRELLELIDERDKLERKRMSTERNAHHERSGLAATQAEASNVAQRTADGSARQNTKECVIQ